MHNSNGTGREFNHYALVINFNESNQKVTIILRTCLSSMQYLTAICDNNDNESINPVNSSHTVKLNVTPKT